MNLLEIVRENLSKLGEERTALNTELHTITEDRDAFGDTEAARGDEIVARLTAIGVKEDELKAREAELVDIEERNARANLTPSRAPRTDEPTDVGDIRYVRPQEARDRAMRVLERDSNHLHARQKDNLDRLLRTRNGDTDGDWIARMTILTENEYYRSAFAKSVGSAGNLLTPDEQRAMLAVQEFRAMSSTTTAGGFGVPVLIDPTIILTSGAADAPVLRIARVETITTDTWKGVSSAGMSWSFDSEGAAVSDDSPTVAQPSVSVHEARGFIPYSVRIGMDYPSFAEEMTALLGQGYLDLLALKTVIATGTGEPWGIFTAIDQTAGSEVAVTSDGNLLAADFRKVWAELPERYRPRASWLYDVSVDNVARSLSPNGMGSEYTINLTDERVPQLFNRPTYITDYAPAFTGTTGAANILVVGDFSNYLIAQRAGMTVENVPHLFDVTDNRPTLQRGFLAWARVGADSVNDAAFRLLQNT
jgi:HK97 family phage major capsid protein